jgi:ABC-type transporter Mla MlaB component
VIGMITLVDVQEVAAATGASVRIAGAAPSVRRLVALAGLNRVLYPRSGPAVTRIGGQGRSPDRR